MSDVNYSLDSLARIASQNGIQPLKASAGQKFSKAMETGKKVYDALAYLSNRFSGVPCVFKYRGYIAMFLDETEYSSFTYKPVRLFHDDGFMQVLVDSDGIDWYNSDYEAPAGAVGFDVVSYYEVDGGHYIILLRNGKAYDYDFTSDGIYDDEMSDEKLERYKGYMAQLAEIDSSKINKQDISAIKYLVDLAPAIYGGDEFSNACGKKLTALFTFLMNSDQSLRSAISLRDVFRMIVTVYPFL